MSTFKVFTDASSRYKAVLLEGAGRPKKVYPSSIGFVVKCNNHTLYTVSECIGLSDSNYAEFMSMFAACRFLIDLGVHRVDFYADCLNLVLMVNQGIISGEEHHRKLSYAILDSLRFFDYYTMTWVSRCQNKEAHHAASLAFKRTVSSSQKYVQVKAACRAYQLLEGVFT